MNGYFPVDVIEYTQELHQYLLNRGAKEYDGWTSSFRPRNLKQYIPTNFPNCKPTHFGATIRVFFPSEDEVLLFSIAFGHLIINSRNKKINEILHPNE